MDFSDSYLGRLRKRVGGDLVLMPGAMVVVQRADQRVLLTQRSDTGSWCLPGGAAEEGGSFARTALDELAEETGIEVAIEDLTAFGCLSEAESHTIRYPNGDLTHCFAVCFLVRDWQGQLEPDGVESTAVCFVALDELPQPMHEPSAHALALFTKYLEEDSFQIG